MIATIPYIEAKFDEFNKLIFGGELPRIPIVLGKRKGQVASFSCRLYKIFFLKKKYIDPKFTFSTRYDYTERQLEDVIIHEMIHYYIRFKGLKDEGSHGSIYVKIMNEINQKFGRKISIRHKGAVKTNEQITDAKPRYRVVAVVTMKDGKTGIKVLPRIKEKIRHYYNSVSTSPTVSKVELYITLNPFFGQYPCSSALRIHYIDHSTLQPQLQGSTKLSLKDIL